jgi:CheY-like chemotaxis protein
MGRILLIDDDDLLRRFVAALLERRNYSVQSAENGDAGIKLAAKADFDLVITDIAMPGTEGLETIRHLRRDKPDIKILAISGGGAKEGGDYLHHAKQLGATATLSKPFDSIEFLDVVAGLIKSAAPG